ncbi:MAG: NAD(+)/NADH kinase [Microthrixaceae bacterium]|nr:NAD(+)/NADH kinase [Microthrixaceae bacterium]MCB1011668.1 NAD(+)/NADH kinase [Microthrixaceae bacterium]MCB9386555.1 NAD(+)/NADH kinase [Microthrixaceae bacterium]MCO5320076.1 NAD(+)/NADH kinase [Microthrixaceae bacterium]
MSSFGFVLHEKLVPEDVAGPIEWLIDRGHQVSLPEPDATRVERPDLGVDDDDFAVGLDLVVAMGGDGTMLRAADLAVREQLPVLGANLGTLGYLTEVDSDGISMALKRFLSGAYRIEERMRLDVVVKRLDGRTEHSSALNEVVVEKSAPGHTVRLDVELDGNHFTSWVADGLILGTPTGSTAYSFSVGGPIVDPVHRAVIMAPVAPHMLFDRTMVLRPDCEVKVVVAGPRDGGLSLDGRPKEPLRPGEIVLCTAAERSSLFVTFGDRDFHKVLRDKLGLWNR